MGHQVPWALASVSSPWAKDVVCLFFLGAKNSGCKLAYVRSTYPHVKAIFYELSAFKESLFWLSSWLDLPSFNSAAARSTSAMYKNRIHTHFPSWQMDGNILAERCIPFSASTINFAGACKIRRWTKPPTRGLTAPAFAFCVVLAKRHNSTA